MKASLFAALGAGVTIPALGVFLRYRHDMKAAQARQDAVERHVVQTQWGAVAYAERGQGDPVLASHGIFQNCVNGLVSVRDLFDDRRVISPSRFGYLGSSMPPNATPATQADAFAALLDALNIREIDVVGFSAGTPAAVQMALRHPDRVKHLVVVVGNLPGSPTAIVYPSWTRHINRQFVMWVLKTFAPSTGARLVAGVPKSFAMSADDVRVVNEFADSLFPMSAEGYNFDLFVSNADVNNYDFEAIRVPTLLIHTRDDQVTSHAASQRVAERIPGARFLSLESGGHIILGQQERARAELASFLAEKGDRRAARAS